MVLGGQILVGFLGTDPAVLRAAATRGHGWGHLGASGGQILVAFLGTDPGGSVGTDPGGFMGTDPALLPRGDTAPWGQTLVALGGTMMALVGTNPAGA